MSKQPNTTYYLVQRDGTVTKKHTVGLASTRYYHPQWVYDASQVWCEGPQGGISLVWQDYYNRTFFKSGYCKSNPEAMKAFMWIKMRAIDPA